MFSVVEKIIEKVKEVPVYVDRIETKEVPVYIEKVVVQVCSTPAKERALVLRAAYDIA